MAKFYVSSTYSDLSGYRSEVVHTLRRMGHDAVAMEDYVAADQRPLAQCLADVGRCDGYIGIVAWRRGFVPDQGNPEGKSITELEYARASERNLPRLVFMLSPAAPWPSEAKDRSGDEEPGHRSIESFRAQLAKDHVVSFFETPHQLALLVSIAIRKWEIESGYTTPVPSLGDQPLPEELRVESYIPGRELRLFYDESLLARTLRWVFIALWFVVPLSVIFATLFPSLVPFVERGDRRSTAGLVLFAVLGAWVALRRKRIWFDFESGNVTIQGLGGFEVARPRVGALTLVTKEGNRGWQASVRYGPCTLLTTNRFPSREEARENVVNFALALNFALGMNTLDEKTESRANHRATSTEQQRTAESSHWRECLLGAGAVFIPICSYRSIPALFDTAEPIGHRLAAFAWNTFAVLAFTLAVSLFAGVMLQGTHKASRTKGRAFSLGFGMAAGLVLLAYLSR